MGVMKCKIHFAIPMVFEGPFPHRGQPLPTLRAHHESTLTFGKWKKRGAINNSTRIIIKTTGMLHSCQTREYRKKMHYEHAIKLKILLSSFRTSGKSMQVYELSKLQCDVSTIFTVRVAVRLFFSFMQSKCWQPTFIHVCLVTDISFLPHQSCQIWGVGS